MYIIKYMYNWLKKTTKYLIVCLVLLFHASAVKAMQDLYGPPRGLQTAYGMPVPKSPISFFWSVVSVPMWVIISVPIIIIVGIVVILVRAAKK